MYLVLPVCLLASISMWTIYFNYLLWTLNFLSHHQSMIGLMLKIGMWTFGKCQILCSAWLVTKLTCQPHKKLSMFGIFLFCQVLARPIVGIKPIILCSTWNWQACRFPKNLLYLKSQTYEFVLPPFHNIRCFCKLSYLAKTSYIMGQRE